jgi:hypothetical protein
MTAEKEALKKRERVKRANTSSQQSHKMQSPTYHSKKKDKNIHRDNKYSNLYKHALDVDDLDSNDVDKLNSSSEINIDDLESESIEDFY